MGLFVEMKLRLFRVLELLVRTRYFVSLIVFTLFGLKSTYLFQSTHGSIDRHLTRDG